MIRKWAGLILKWAVAAFFGPLVWTSTRSFVGALASADFLMPQRFVAFMEGFGLYLAFHIAFWKPAPVYLLGHRVLQKLFQMVLGGQVGTIPQGATGQGAEVAAKPGSGGARKEQVLAAVSPALIPVYTLLLVLVIGLVRQWSTVVISDQWIAGLAGLTVGLHLLMAVDTIQATRAQQTFVAYLITLELIVLSTLTVTLLCLAFLLPDLSVGAYFQQSFQEAVAIYTAGLRDLLY